MKEYKITEDNCMETMRTIIMSNEEAFQKGIVSQTCVLKGKGECNDNYCIANSIKVIQGYNIGNPIVLHEGDIELGYFIKGDANNLFSEFVNNFIFFLKNNGISEIRYDGNDFMIDNYKIAASSMTILNSLTYIGIHFSMNVDLNLIDNICTKLRKKIPKGLCEYGITNEDIEMFVSDFNSKYLEIEDEV